MILQDLCNHQPSNKEERGGNKKCLQRATLSDKVIHPRKGAGAEQFLPKVGGGVLKIEVS